MIDKNITEAEYLYDVEYYFENGSEIHSLTNCDSVVRSEPRYYKDTSKKQRGDLYRCTRCGQYKPKSEFYKDARVPCGIRSKCKECYHK